MVDLITKLRDVKQIFLRIAELDDGLKRHTLELPCHGSLHTTHHPAKRDEGCLNVSSLLPSSQWSGGLWRRRSSGAPSVWTLELFRVLADQDGFSNNLALFVQVLVDF